MNKHLTEEQIRRLRKALRGQDIEAILTLALVTGMRQMETRLEVGSAWENLDLVFPNHVGGFLGPDQLLKGFQEIIEQTALPPIRFQDLRGARWRALREQIRSAKQGDCSRGQKGDIE